MADTTAHVQVSLPQERVECHVCGYFYPVEHRYCGLCGADSLDRPLP